jgi:hypothetical protein
MPIMKTRSLSASLTPIFSALVVLALLLGSIGTGSSQAAPLLPGQLQAPTASIVVTSGGDPDLSNSSTCLTASPCTLRRAVIQARAAAKPVSIQFNIPTSDSSYNSTYGIWKIQFGGISSSSNASLHYLNGGITIDGTTQPGERTSGPKIILVGYNTGQLDGLKLGETAAQNGNIIRGLGFQNFKTHIYINSASNLIENNWFGLNDAGTEISFRASGVADDGSGNAGITVSANVINNVIQHNVFAGLMGVAATIGGDNSTFSDNYVGTTANGTVPAKQTDPALICSPVDWLGGGGISLSGSSNLVENNIFAGLRLHVDPPTIQADTIRMSGNNHIIRNNKIGLDSASAEIGVCGRGIYLLSGAELNQITTNTIVKPGLSGISLNDTVGVSTTDANTLRGNVIKKITPWGERADSTSPEDAIQVTKSMPLAFRNFKPAKVTVIDGVSVTGASGTGSLCPNCVIELFLEDLDAINESLSSLVVVTADGSGNWTATLPAALTPGQGIRTTSTTAAYGTIASLSAGTTTGLSDVYTPVQRVFVPVCKK